MGLLGSLRPVRIAVIGLVVAGLLAGAVPGSATAYVHWWEQHPLDQRQAMTDFFSGTRPDNVHVFKLGNSTATTHYAETVGSALESSLDRVPRTMANGAAINRERWQGLFRSGLFQSLGGRLASGGISKIAVRAIPGTVALGLLMEFGTGLYADVVLNESPGTLLGVNLARVDSGGAPVCARYYSSWFYATPSGWGCENMPPMPAGQLYPNWFTYRASDGSVREIPVRICNNFPEPGMGLIGSTGTIGIRCSASDVWSQKAATHYYYPSAGDAYLPDTPPRTSPAPWTGTETLDQGRHRIPIPPMPTDIPAMQGAIEDVLESPEGTALRCQIDWILSELPGEDSPIYAPGQPAPTLTPPDPAAGSPATGATQACELADTLLSQNDQAVQEGRLTPVRALIIARKCLERADMSECGSLPIFVAGRYDWPAATDHIIRGLEYEPTWYKLRYYNRPATEATWKTGMPETDPPRAECKGRGVQPDPTATACDEFPFLRTEQGALKNSEGADNSPLAHLKVISARDNSGSGGAYGNLLVSRCAMEARRSSAAHGGGHFLVVAVESEKVPTFGLCNGLNPGA